MKMKLTSRAIFLFLFIFTTASSAYSKDDNSDELTDAVLDNLIGSWSSTKGGMKLVVKEVDTDKGGKRSFKATFSGHHDGLFKGERTLTYSGRERYDDFEFAAYVNSNEDDYRCTWGAVTIRFSGNSVVKIEPVGLSFRITIKDPECPSWNVFQILNARNAGGTYQGYSTDVVGRYTLKRDE